ncbi:MAG: FtsX-like permease family protein [Planctomycetes bacterium]|nr:FtsX-like permease family protein [Planctomycetota bacterium]
MSLVRTIAGTSLRKRPGRTLFSILGVGLGIAVAIAVFVLDHDTVLGLSLPGLTDWKPALEVRPTKGLEDPRSDLEHTAGVAGVAAFFQNEVSLRRAQPSGEGVGSDTDRVKENAPGGEERVVARLFAIESKGTAQLDAYRVDQGRDLEPSAQEREVLVGTELSEALHLVPGDVLLLSRPPQQPRMGCVDGVVKALDPNETIEVPVEERFTVVGVLAREKLGQRSKGMLAVVDYGWGKELYRGTSLAPVYWVRQNPQVDVENLKKSLAGSYSYQLNKSVLIGAAAQERAFRNGVRLAGLLALVLGLYVIFHTLSIALVERVREIATLHALGTSRAQITRIFLFEACVISVCAAALGIGGGLGLARASLLAGITTLGTGHRIELFVVPWPTVLGLAGIGLVVALLGSVYPLLRARQASPVAALRGEAPSEYAGVARGFHLFAALLLAVLLPALYFVVVPVVGEAQGVLVGAVLAAVGMLALLVVLPLLVPGLVRTLSKLVSVPLARAWTFSGRMAAFAIRESGSRIAVSAAAIALVASAFVGLKGMTASLRGEIVVWAQEALVDKVYLSRMPPTPLATLKQHLMKFPGVLAIETGSARSYSPFLLLGMRAAELAKYGPLAEDPELAAKFARGEGLVLSRQLARQLDYKKGDRVHVSNAAGDVQDLEVLAISDAYGYFPHPDERLYGVVGDVFSHRAFYLDVVNLTECSVVLAPGTDPDVVKAAVREMWPQIDILRYEPGPMLLALHLDDLERDFRLFDLILGMTALLAGLGVLNGLLLSALERTKELGVLKALGAGRRQIAGMVLCESFVVGVIGGLVGTALGAGLTPVIVRALEGLSGLDLPDVSAGLWLLWVPLGSVALAVLAALVPILRMNRTDPVAAVRTG